MLVAACAQVAMVTSLSSVYLPGRPTNDSVRTVHPTLGH